MHDDLTYDLPDGSYWNVFIGPCDIIYVPFWLQQEIARFVSSGAHSEVPPKDWTCAEQITFDIAIGLSTDITNQKEFEILINTLDKAEAEIGGLKDQALIAIETYANAARQAYYQAIKQFYADEIQREHCTVCRKEKRTATHDTCARCRKEYWREEQRVKIHLYQARKASTPATLTLGQWIETLKHYNRCCAYCKTGPYEVLEHFIPISAGGGTTQENCIPACHSCNAKKQAENPDKL